MTYFEWDDSYSVGIRSIDLQHRELIKLINRLHDLRERGGDLLAVLKRLDWYVQHHFSFEESLMRGAGYPRLKEHIKEHREFERWLRTSQTAVRSGLEVREMSAIIQDFLKEWLSKHILVIDMDYKALLTADANRGRSIDLLTAELVKTLEDARGKPTPDALDKALALARDVRQCAEAEARD